MNPASRRLLVIDDEAVLRSLLSDMLEACGYQADVAADGPSGLARFREGRYEAVITDLLMPGMNGLQVATEIRMLDPEARIILLTGSAPALTYNRARESGVTTLLHKPIALADLKTAVDAACSPAGCR
jgi:two-component system capsular synthesis sensor histidine kinase RcsC